MSYKAVKVFRDLKDGGKVYAVGDTYTGSKAKKRLTELTSEKNKVGEILIEKVTKTKKE